MFDHTYTRLLYGALAGIISGVLGGLLGMSGSIIILPILVFFKIFINYKMAIATVLFGFEPFGSIFALIQYAKENKIDYLMGILIAVSYMLGSYIGAKFNKRLSEKKIKNISATLMLILSFYMFYNAYKIKS
jgi:uncharacterized membrane protein YfcA